MNDSHHQRKNHDYRYTKLADALEGQIVSGNYRAGEKLPSLRILQQQTGLSISTVAQAYGELENRGLIEPRQKSGFYVKPLLRDMLPPLENKKFSPKPRKVAVNFLAEAIAEAIRVPDMVPLGAAVPALELLPLKQLAASLRTVSARYIRRGQIGYGPATGIQELKKQIARRALLHGERIDEEEIVITNGCMDAIHLCLRAVARPGDAIIVESPTFTCYLQLIEDLNMLVLEVPSHPERGLDLKALEKTLQEHPVGACILCPNHHNPLGFEMPLAAKKRLLELVTARQIPLIEDDIYGDLHFGHHRPPTLKSLDTSGLVLHCSSYSKTLAPDLRVGWALPGKFLEQVKRLRFNSVIATAKLNQLIVADFLASGSYDRHLRKLKTALKNQVSQSAAAISRYFPAGTRISSPRGGYVIWVELPDGVDGMTLFDRAREEKIFIMPGQICTGTDKYRNCIRISCGHPWNEEIENGFKRLGELAGE